jgi:hypothetical protein
MSILEGAWSRRNAPQTLPNALDCETERESRSVPKTPRTLSHSRIKSNSRRGDLTVGRVGWSGDQPTTVTSPQQPPARNSHQPATATSPQQRRKTSPQYCFPARRAMRSPSPGQRPGKRGGRNTAGPTGRPFVSFVERSARWA